MGLKAYFSLIFLLLGCHYHGVSQKMVVHVFMENKKAKATSDTIYYDFNRQLMWSDFQGKPDTASRAGAVTGSGFAFDSEMNSDGNSFDLSIGVYCFFSKHSSWKKKDINTDYHLLHEQHHFDITRIGAQKLVEALKNARFTKDNYRSLINAVFTKVYDENNALQQQYDRETKNSMDVKKQLEWNERITTEITKLPR
jgi:hypothetical protein